MPGSWELLYVVWRVLTSNELATALRGEMGQQWGRRSSVGGAIAHLDAGDGLGAEPRADGVPGGLPIAVVPRCVAEESVRCCSHSVD